MPTKKKQHPAEQSENKAKKDANLNTRGKNAAGQTNGQFEQDIKRRAGQFTQAGEAPIMKK
ncbi:MAG TPA: hypothetical protein VER03_18985 [Bryobacteraceae bacterium]|nr:hypothetical protein [Bryobacteraceae bacterium]